jgi:DNA replication protein DnaC
LERLSPERKKELFEKFKLTQYRFDPERAAREREEYRALLAARQAEIDGGGTAADLRSRALKALIPPKELNWALAAKPTMALEAARRWISDTSSPYLALLGPPGTGKSVAAAIVLLGRLRESTWNGDATGIERWPVMWVQAGELTRVSAFGDSHTDWLKAMRGAELLCLDDLGDEATELGKAQLVDVVLARHRTGRRTIVTSNLRADAIRKRYGDALVDRIREGMAPDLTGEKSMRGRT